MILPCLLIVHLKLQSSLQDAFQMKDLGPLSYFLVMEVCRTKTGFFLHQHKYVMDLIELVNLQESTPMDTPLEVHVKLNQTNEYLLPDPTIYYRFVKSLVYLTITRPNITYVDNIVSQFMTAHRHLHLAYIKCIIQYILGSPTHGLFFPIGTPLTLIAYSHADWTRRPYTHRSTTGW